MYCFHKKTLPGAILKLYFGDFQNSLGLYHFSVKLDENPPSFSREGG